MKCIHRIVLGLAAISAFTSCSAYRASVDAVSSAASAVGSVASKAVDAVTPGSKSDDAGAKADWNDVVFTVDLDGTERKFVIRLRPDLAPKHVANFKEQVSSGAYPGLAVHRAIRSYLVQMGDPLTKDESQKNNWGTGGDSKKTAPEGGGKHTRGAVAMARLGDALNPQKLSSATQFYVMLKSAPSLDGEYTVFGEVVQGLDSLEKVAATVVDSNDTPARRIEIKSAKLVPPTSRELAAPKSSSRGQTQSENEKGALTKFIERIW